MAASMDAVLDVIAKEAGVDRASLRPDATFAEMDISSLDMMSALFTLEDEFGVAIDPEQLGPAATLRDLVDLVNAPPAA